MGNALEFILKLTDMLSPGLKQAAAISDSTAAKIENGFQSIADKGKVMGASINELKDRLEAVNKVRLSTKFSAEFDIATQAARRLEAQINKLENKGSQNSPGLLSGALGRFAPAAMMAGALAFGTSSAKAAMDFEATKKTFEVLTGSASTGKALAGSLNSLQQQTILGPEVFKAAQTLMGFGVAADKVVGIEKMLGDVSMGNKEKFESLSLVFAQTQAAGKLMGQDLMQYINAGFNPLTVMSEKWEQFGFKQKVSVGQLKDMMSNGAITADMVSKAFELATSAGGKFDGMMDKMSGTSYGKLQILQGQWENFKVGVGNSLQGVTDKLMDMASATLNLLTPTKSVAQEVQEQTQKIYGLTSQLTAANTNESQRKTILQQLHDINPNITKDINAESIEYGKLATNINNVIAALMQKKIAQDIQDNSLDSIFKFNKAQQSRGLASASMAEGMAQAAAMFPDIALNTGMSNGQKQIAYQDALKRKIESEGSKLILGAGGMGYGQTRIDSEADKVLSMISGSIKQFNQQNDIVKSLQPKIDDVNKQTKAAMDIYTKTWGGITPPGATGDGAATSGGSATSGGAGGDSVGAGGSGIIPSGKERADAINTGGQRSIVINIAKQAGVENLVVASGKEAVDEIESKVTEVMRRLFYSINGAANT